MNSYNPWVTENEDGFTIISKTPLPLGRFIERIITSGKEVVASGKFKVTGCDLSYYRRNYYKITLKRIDSIINIEELI